MEEMKGRLQGGRGRAISLQGLQSLAGMTEALGRQVTPHLGAMEWGLIGAGSGIAS